MSWKAAIASSVHWLLGLWVKLPWQGNVLWCSDRNLPCPGRNEVASLSVAKDMTQWPGSYWPVAVSPLYQLCSPGTLSLQPQRQTLMGLQSAQQSRDDPRPPADVSGGTVNNNIFQICCSKAREITKYLVHEPLESRWSTVQPKWQDCKLDETPGCPEGRQFSGPLSERHLPGTLAQIYCGQAFSPTQLFKQVINSGCWVRIKLRNGIQVLEVNAEHLMLPSFFGTRTTPKSLSAVRGDLSCPYNSSEGAKPGRGLGYFPVCKEEVWQPQVPLLPPIIRNQAVRQWGDRSID